MTSSFERGPHARHTVHPDHPPLCRNWRSRAAVMAVTLTLAVLAAVSLESVREGLQNTFAWACTVVADNMWAAATVTLLLAAMCALLAMLLRPAPLGPIVSVTSKRGPKWQYFVYGNVVAAIVFPVSLAWLATILADSGFSVNSMSLSAPASWSCRSRLSRFSLSWSRFLPG